MRDILNLQALKHSKSRKHQTIYEKAHRLLQKGWETVELSESQILEIASAFPQLSVKVAIGGDIIIKSKKDTWVLRDEVRFYTLYHKSFTIERGRMKDRYHVQDVFYDLEFVLASVISHDEYKLGTGKLNMRKVQELADQGQVCS